MWSSRGLTSGPPPWKTPGGPPGLLSGCSLYTVKVVGTRLPIAVYPLPPWDKPLMSLEVIGQLPVPHRGSSSRAMRPEGAPPERGPVSTMWVF